MLVFCSGVALASLMLAAIFLHSVAHPRSASFLLYASLQMVRPFTLNQIVADSFFSVWRSFTDVADLALMLLVFEPVPAVARDRVGNRFTEFVRACESEEIELAQTARTGDAKRLDRVKQVLSDNS